MTILSIRITDELLLKLKSIATAEERSVGWVVRQLIQKASGDRLAQASSFEDLPDPRTPSAPTMPVSCTRCRNLGYACTAHA